MYKRIMALVVALPFALAACEGSGPKQTGGTLAGAGVGALIGSQIGHGSGKLAAVAIGTLAGAMIGSEVGKSLDRADRLAMQQTTQKALESNRSGRASTWRNPDSGHSGTITPTKTYDTAAGQPCREYQQTVTIGGKTESAYGTACRQNDGSWKIVN
jgi:surface antigen